MERESMQPELFVDIHRQSFKQKIYLNDGADASVGCIYLTQKFAHDF